MKKYRLFVLLSLGLFSSTVVAQRFRHHEFSCALGFGPNVADNEVANMRDYYIGRHNLINDGECGDVFGDSFVTFNLEYHYRLDKRWAVGATMGWGYSSESYTQDYYTPATAEVNTGNHIVTMKYGDETSSVFYMAPSLRYAWFLKGKFRLYSRIALGAMRQHTSFNYKEVSHTERICNLGYYHLDSSEPASEEEENTDETRWKLAYQLTPIGFDFGIEPIRVYSELGYGYRGVFTIGVRLAL